MIRSLKTHVSCVPLADLRMQLNLTLNFSRQSFGLWPTQSGIRVTMGSLCSPIRSR